MTVYLQHIGCQVNWPKRVALSCVSCEWVKEDNRKERQNVYECVCVCVKEERDEGEKKKKGESKLMNGVSCVSKFNLIILFFSVNYDDASRRLTFIFPGMSGTIALMCQC